MTETNSQEKSNGAEVENKTAEMENQPAEIAASTELTPLEASIIRQVEYYFGDMNLPKDKFLQEQIGLDDGWVPFDIMLKFKRLASISDDSKVISDALAKSETGLTEISEDGKKLRRNPEHPLPELNEERRLELQSRSLYVKGFPLDSTIDNCLEFFKDYPANAGLTLRRYKDRDTGKWCFKGSVFVTYKTKEDAEKFLNQESVKINGVESIRKWQKDYFEEKRIEQETRKIKKKDRGHKEREKNGKQEFQEPQVDIKLPLGTVLKIMEVTEKITKESIKDAIKDLGGEVAYVDFQMGDREGWIRLKVENSAKEVYEKCKDGKISINNDEIPCQLLDGDDEKNFLLRMADELMKRRQEQQRSFKNKKFKGGKQHHGKKRKGGRNEDEPKIKKEKA